MARCGGELRGVARFRIQSPATSPLLPRYSLQLPATPCYFPATPCNSPLLPATSPLLPATPSYFPATPSNSLLFPRYFPASSNAFSSNSSLPSRTRLTVLFIGIVGVMPTPCKVEPSILVTFIPVKLIA